MHIAVARKVPVVALFGPSDSRRYAPYRQESNVIKCDWECQPCGKHSCEIGHVCMEKITVAMVLSKLSDVLIK